MKTIINLEFYAFPRVHCIGLVLSFLSGLLANYLQSNLYHFHARAITRKRKTWFAHLQNIICRHSWTTLHMSRPLFVGSYLQFKWWAVGQWKGKKIASKDNISLLKEHNVQQGWKNLKLNIEGAGLPEFETSSMSLPSKTISSFTVELAQVTPGLILTRLTYFSPKKLRTSTRVPLSETAMLMGKWAYTAFILYLKP